MGPLLRCYGLWQQVRIDHASEFVLAASFTSQVQARSPSCSAKHITSEPQSRAYVARSKLMS